MVNWLFKIIAIIIFMVMILCLIDQYNVIQLSKNNMQIELEHFDDIWGQLGDPVLVEQKFLELLPYAYKLKNQSIYLQILSQLALAQAVQKKFDQAHATLDKAEKLLTPEYQLAHVRILCERGRTFQQAGDIEQALLYFEKSYELSNVAHFDKETINAAHMIAIVALSSAEKIAWNQKALNLALSAHDRKAQSWCGPIWNNLGANYLEDQQLEKALDAFEHALKDFERFPEYQSNTRFARFRIAQVLRLLGRLDEALQILLRQEAEYDILVADKTFDMPQDMFTLMHGWLYEELALVYTLQHHDNLAVKYAQLALAYLHKNKLFIATQPDYQVRIEKLKKIHKNI